MQPVFRTRFGLPWGRRGQEAGFGVRARENTEVQEVRFGVHARGNIKVQEGMFAAHARGNIVIRKGRVGVYARFHKTRNAKLIPWLRGTWINEKIVHPRRACLMVSVFVVVPTSRRVPIGKF